MKRAARIARWVAFVVTALAAGDLLAMLVANRVAPEGAVANLAANTANQTRRRLSHNDTVYLQPIVKRNLFHVASAEQKLAEKPPDPTEVVPTSALAQRFELVGTVVSNNRNESVAVVQERAGAQDSKIYPLGDRLGDEAEIVGIESRRIVLDVSGKKEQIEIELEGDQPGASTPFRATPAAAAATTQASDVSDGSIRRNPDGSFTLDSRMVEGQLANLSELLTQARAVPNFEDGKTNGFRLFSIKRGSIFDQIGLRNGDVIRKVNSNELNDPAVALNVFQDLRSARDFQVTVFRNNHEETLSYQVR